MFLYDKEPVLASASLIHSYTPYIWNFGFLVFGLFFLMDFYVEAAGRIASMFWKLEMELVEMDKILQKYNG